VRSGIDCIVLNDDQLNGTIVPYIYSAEYHIRLNNYGRRLSFGRSITDVLPYVRSCNSNNFS
jgi:hypothetical protein